MLSGLAAAPELAVALGLDWALPSTDLSAATDRQLRAELAKRVSARAQVGRGATRCAADGKPAW